MNDDERIHWDRIRDALTSLAMDNDELEPGEVVGHIVIAYQTTRVMDDFEVEFGNTYATSPNSSADTAIGMLTLARSQILAALTYGSEDDD